MASHALGIRATLATIFLLASLTTAFYLPGVAPTSYREGDLVPLNVNVLTPGQSEQDAHVHAAESYDYYLDTFHFCKPKDGPVAISESLGSILFGDRILTSAFELRMKKDQTCKVFESCGPQTFDKGDARFVNRLIREAYELNWLIDGLPAAQQVRDLNTDIEYLVAGLPLGRIVDEQPVLNNHYDILIDYHEPTPGQYRVVGIRADPSSKRNAKDLGGGRGECPTDDEPIVLDEAVGGTQVVFTYSVYWRPSATPFATRWDKYLHVYDPKIHWFSLVNSAVIVTFLSVMVFLILVRTLRKDITRYNRLDSFALSELSGGGGDAGAADGLDDGVQEDSGWKLVHGDVFRPPRLPLVLSVLCGNGVQLFLMAGLTIVFALLGFLSPSNRGSLGSVTVLLYTLLSTVSGFVSAWTYKSLGGEDRWRANLILTPLALPLAVFGCVFGLNLFLWAGGASGALPFTTMLVLVALWFLISLPLSLAGAWLGFKRPALPPPVRVNQIPRQIPEPAQTAGLAGWLQRPVPATLLMGILPFGAIFVELYFVMNSLWGGRVYYMFGFLFLCYGLMAVTCATVTVLAVYFQLCAEDYRWQWRSVMTGGACALYVFLNALVFWASRLSFSSWVSSVLYLGYSALLSLLVFVLTGALFSLLLLFPCSLSQRGSRAIDSTNANTCYGRHNRFPRLLALRAQNLPLH